MFNKIFLKKIISLGVCSSTLLMLSTGSVFARDNEVRFELTDNPGSWFDTGKSIAGNRSIAVATPGVRVKFSGNSNTVHTRTSVIYPTGAANMPFNTEPRKGGDDVTLTTPGLYVFTCSIHPYMFGAVIVDDPKTAGLDLGSSISLINGITIPSSSDLATRLLRTFFIATNPANWQDYASNKPWHVTYPNVDVRVDIGVVNLPDVLNTRYGNDITLSGLKKPKTPAVGEIWVATQFETTRNKEKPGTVSAIDGSSWQVTRKVALPSIDMNNPHNMWTDKNQRVIYVTQWFDSKLTVYDRKTGKLIRNVSVGESPAHVMTLTDSDRLHVTNNGDTRTDSVMELAPLATQVLRRVDIGRGNAHAHWMSHDGKTMVTPNVFSGDSTQYNFHTDAVEAILSVSSPFGHPLAIGMMPDASKYYVANLLDSTMTVVNMDTHKVTKRINLIKNYDPIAGAITGPVGALPIQTPVSPDGTNMVTANMLSGTITIINTNTDKVVAMLPCDPGCHGVQYGAKQGGGYYAYVSSKFSNRLLIVDPDPNNDGDPSDAKIAGTVALFAAGTTQKDDAIKGNPGMGGQGILPIPVVYNGWVQNLPAAWSNQLTPAQRNPID
ncbi:copper oxidase [Nitrosomonas ureae]|uniref:DNA-binding beta-propeller fold protein YncE n=1 Tax=Nitrosomonas ureae TaxID=44577 RepID=A0A1H5TBF4_9PROT|nr:copper oxidase [Nitrosomonas ureae]SEF59391.1 DNA-binding beta-propeller fold protein YncE [Nitrosomonas ureae]